MSVRNVLTPSCCPFRFPWSSLGVGASVRSQTIYNDDNMARNFIYLFIYFSFCLNFLVLWFGVGVGSAFSLHNSSLSSMIPKRGGRESLAGSLSKV